MVIRGSIGYFGIPKDKKLIALWDDVADRLYKLRNGMTIDGVQLQLPLFSPPIDPALLAEAAAAGLDVAARGMWRSKRRSFTGILRPTRTL